MGKRNADKLHFPVIKGRPLPPPVLSMDEYAKLVELYLQDPANRKAIEARRFKQVIKEPFKLK